VVLTSMLNLSRAIEYAAEQGAHVISISLGGIMSWRLREAILFAQSRGVIICAAAGNHIGFVAWPAAYDEVIACAASNARRQIWSGSSRGSKVDVTAPGESVWCAYVKRVNGGLEQKAHRSSGTSYAVAAVAGIAALWLSYHGRDTLIGRYGSEKLAGVFSHILRSACEPVGTWGPPGKFGAGLVNAERTLLAKLPDPGQILEATPTTALESHVPLDAGQLDTFAHLFESSSLTGLGAERGSVLEARLAELLGIVSGDLRLRLREVGQELAFHLATHPELYRAFRGTLGEINTLGIEATSGNLSMVRDHLLSKVSSGVLARRLSGI